MKEFFDTMDLMERIYWYIAIGASIIFIIQSIMTFAGADADTGGDADFDSNLDDSAGPFQLFSFRNLINFLLGFGWGGVSLYGVIPNHLVLGIVAGIVGLVFVGIFFLIMRSMMRLAEDNTVDIKDAIGKTAEVYLKIPGKQAGQGKVMVSMKGSTRELSAMTEEAETLNSRSIVKIVDIRDNILIVESLESHII